MHVVAGIALKGTFRSHIQNTTGRVLRLPQSVIAGELHHVHVLVIRCFIVDDDSLIFLALMHGVHASIGVVLLSSNCLARLLCRIIYRQDLHGGRSI